MNAPLRGFSRLTWVGIAVNLGFALVLLLAPDVLEALLGPGSTEFAVQWLPFAGLLLLVNTLLYLPAAANPAGLPVYAWLSVVGRGLSATYWLWTRSRWDLPGLVGGFWILDGFFGLALLVLLQWGLPAEHKISASGSARAVAGWGRAVTVLLTERAGALKVFGLVSWAAILASFAFALVALVNPAATQRFFHGVLAEWAYLWLGYCAVLLVQLGLYLLPAGPYPVRYRVFAWASPLFWIASSILWFLLASNWSPNQLWIVDGLLGVALLVLLQHGLSETYGFTPSRFGAWLRERAAQAGRVLASPLDLLLLAAVLGLGAFLVHGVSKHLLTVEPDPVFSDPAEHFKYGAIGLAVEARVPLYLWEVLPEICGDLLPDPSRGAASLGLIYEDGRDLPIGFARRDLGYPTIEPNCALCHVGNYRTELGGEEQIALGGAAHALDLQGFQNFLYECAASPAFDLAAVTEKIRAAQNLGFLETQLYRWVVLPTTRSGLETQRQAYAWQKKRPEQGRGRTDTFNPTKITVFNLPDDGTIGTVDLPAIWNQRAREGMWLHWDGNNNAIAERNYAAAMAVGATPHSVLPEHFKVVTDYLLTLEPTPFPFPVDGEKAARGSQVFRAECADCHAFGGPKIGTVTDLAEIGTDSHRLHSFTEQLVENFHSVDEGLFQFDAYRKTQGYANVPLDGIWVRAPYLHNGSVPTLWDLLQKPAERPVSFYRGYEVYDPQRMGFVHQGPEAEQVGRLQDASLPGNGNGGHLYGTDLADEQKWDLIEYLKTL